jgi:hypothetical protein
VLSPLQKAGIAVLVLVMPASFRALCRALDPRIVIAENLHLAPGDDFRGVWIDPRDPWGSEWVQRTVVDRVREPVYDPTRPRIRAYSCGPNRLDESGEGDDVILCDSDGYRKPGALYSFFYYGPPTVLQLLGLVVALGIARRVARAPAASAASELVHAAGLLAPFLVLLGTAFLYPRVRAFFEDAPPSAVTWLPVPWPIALAGSLLVPAYLAAIVVRLKLARKEDLPTNEHEEPSPI